MQVKKWWIYKTRGGTYPVAIICREIRSRWSKWDGYYVKTVQVGKEVFIDLQGAYWQIHGNKDPQGRPKLSDLTTPICSARDLVFRKLNPPTALTVAVEAKRSEEMLFDQSW